MSRFLDNLAYSIDFVVNISIWSVFFAILFSYPRVSLISLIVILLWVWSIQRLDMKQ